MMISAIQVRDGVGGWRRGGDGRSRGEPCLRIPARRAPQQQQRLAHRDTWQRLAHRHSQPTQPVVRAVRRLHNNNRRADRGRERHLNDDDKNRHNNSVSARATCKITAAAATTTGAAATTTGCAELRALLEAPLSRLGVYEEVISANISAISHIGEYSSQSRRVVSASTRR